MKIFLLISKYVKPLHEVDRVLPAHREFLQRFYDDGTFLVSGPLNPRTGGAIVAVGESREDIQNVLAEDPFFTEGISEYEILEFSPTKVSEKWERVFSG
ncbi:MAG TPA: YciI family protein [Candidatus Baltobacteraceae bacterium]|jgi:uncharacterized protein YciI|nr:YciI family protein [Candidatus Baltobacteraceae bacterium]